MSRQRLYNCLIRTHHITSRKKLQKVRRAASQLRVESVIIHYGAPGLMYAESPYAAELSDWVGAVQSLRYKDYRLAAKPELLSRDPGHQARTAFEDDVRIATGFHETETLAQFAQQMELRQISGWWKKLMGYDK